MEELAEAGTPIPLVMTVGETTPNKTFNEHMSNHVIL
jgi:hypothetical protein